MLMKWNMMRISVTGKKGLDGPLDKIVTKYLYKNTVS